MDFANLFKFAVEHGASDVHIQAGVAPMLRIAGEMRQVESEPLTAEQVHQFVASIAPGHITDGNMDDSLAAGMDFSHTAEGLGRFRCSAYRHLGQPAMVARVIRTEMPSLEDLHLPPVIRDIALSRRGMTLVTGTTGSGKSTTLAAMIDLINSSLRTKIVTIEDPIEYVHTSKKAMISQLEVGSDTPSFEQALRQALRQDPDVILIGELRDTETLRIALRAADTGHQVFSTVHSANAAQTVERIIAMFPPVEHKLLLSQLAGSVEAIISQRLVVTRDGSRRPAIEILRGGPVTEKYILENRIADLGEFIANGEAGMQTFDQHLLELYQGDLISGTEAMRSASSPEGMAMAMRGIRGVRAGRGGSS